MFGRSVEDQFFHAQREYRILSNGKIERFTHHPHGRSHWAEVAPYGPLAETIKRVAQSRKEVKDDSGSREVLSA